MSEQKAPASKFTGVPGWETFYEQRLLIKYAEMLTRESCIVEIGSEYGMSASIWALYSRAKQIVCIEQNPDAPFLENLKANDIDPFNIEWLCHNSQTLDTKELLAIMPGNTIDLLFIDGDHSYNGALSDLVKYATFVTKGGYLIIHDVACETNKKPHPLHYEVKQAVDEFMDNGGSKLFKFLESRDTTVVYKRIK